MIQTLTELTMAACTRSPDATALRAKGNSTLYGELGDALNAFASGLVALGLTRGERVAVFADKQRETVIATFGTSLAGGVFVPINALFKPQQVAYILGNCNVRVLVTTRARLALLGDVIAECPDLRHIVVMDGDGELPHAPGAEVLDWDSVADAPVRDRLPRPIGSDMAAIMYTSGSTGMPKGVVLSHANMTIGAQSVAHYLGNNPDDRILAVLPFSFDAGLSQLTTGLASGATVILHDYLLARDVVRIVERESVTGITGVPPLWMQLTGQDWPEGSADSVRYFANTGGKMPRDTLDRLRAIFHNADPYLMYGLTEAFRSTYLPPAEVDKRPDSMGKAIPNVEVMVVREDGSACDPHEVGELVHRGPLVALGYWNDPERTAVRYKLAPGQPEGITVPELAVWSGDLVRMDEDGFLYFVGRKDDMIKTSGYRVSPAEVEEVVFSSGFADEVAALGVDDDQLGQVIVLVAKPREGGSEPTDELLAYMRNEVPNYMLPRAVHWQQDSLPRNANGKLDRKAMLSALAAADDAA